MSFIPKIEWYGATVIDCDTAKGGQGHIKVFHYGE